MATESSASTPFMSIVRDHFGDRAVCVKHADRSMIGQPDFSVTTAGRVFWFEFKLWTPLQREDPMSSPIPIHQFLDQAPTQWDMMCRYASCASGSFYIVWVRATKRIEFWTVTAERTLLRPTRFTTTRDLAQWFINQIEVQCLT